MPETKAQCDNPKRSNADAKKCMAQARADAVKAVGACYLPLEPQNKPHHSWYSPNGMAERFGQWWRDGKELDSYSCAVREIKVKPDYYRVPKYTWMETDTIMQDGMALSDAWKAQGRMRPRKNGRD